MTSRELTWLVENRFLRRPIKNVYLATQLGDSTRLRCECLRLVVPADAVICDRHAGWAQGAEMVLAPGEHLDLRPISVYLPPGRRLRNGLADSGERMLRTEDVLEVNGLRVTTPLRTAWDLGRNRWPDRSLSAMDQMLRLGSFTQAELLEGVRRFKGMRWVTTLRAMAPLTDGRAESPPESVLRLRWLQAGLPAPEPQHEVWKDGRFLARLDLAHEALLFGGEYDGGEWHDTPEQQAHDRERREAVSREADWLVVPFRKQHLFGHQQCADRMLHEGVAEARRRLGLRVTG